MSSGGTSWRLQCTVRRGGCDDGFHSPGRVGAPSGRCGLPRGARGPPRSPCPSLRTGRSRGAAAPEPVYCGHAAHHALRGGSVQARGPDRGRERPCGRIGRGARVRHGGGQKGARCGRRPHRRSGNRRRCGVPRAERRASPLSAPRFFTGGRFRPAQSSTFMPGYNSPVIFFRSKFSSEPDRRVLVSPGQTV